jgi:hypothetical protein
MIDNGLRSIAYDGDILKRYSDPSTYECVNIATSYLNSAVERFENLVLKYISIKLKRCLPASTY